MRIRITFSKTDPMRFTSHLDLHRSLERTFRRAGLPLAYSQGFNPRPRINLASALPLGFTSQYEVGDVWLEERLSIDSIAKALCLAVPPGLKISKIDEVAINVPSLQSQMNSAEYTITFIEGIPKLHSQITRLLDANSLPRERRGKSYDLRPLIEHIQLIPDDDNGHSRLVVGLIAREGATGRPEEIILAMGGRPESVRIHRTRLNFL